jgi:hypothetical protein
MGHGALKPAAFALLLAACGGRAPPAAVALPLPEAGPTRTYSIHLNRPLHVGARENVLLTGDEENVTKTRRGSDPVEEQREVKRARLEGRATVLDVDEKGEAARLVFDLRTLWLERAGRRVVDLRKGRLEITRAPKEQDAVVSLDGAPASADVRDALKTVISFRGGGPSDDEIFGTREAQRVGGRWRIDEKRALEDLMTGDAAGMQGASISGDVWLQGLTRVAGVDCLDVHASLLLDGMDLPNKGPGSAVEQARASASFSGAYPLERTIPRLADHSVIEMAIKIRTPSPAGDIVVEVTGRERRDAEHVPVGLTAKGADAR